MYEWVYENPDPTLLSASCGSRSKVDLAKRNGSSAGKNLRTARWAVEHSVGQVAHLRMTALASVGAQGVGQTDYLAQGLQRGAD